MVCEKALEAVPSVLNKSRLGFASEEIFRRAFKLTCHNKKNYAESFRRWSLVCSPDWQQQLDSSWQLLLGLA
jgi:hypothetical protein